MSSSMVAGKAIFSASKVRSRSESRKASEAASSCASSVASWGSVGVIETALAWKAKFMVASAAVKKRVVRIVSV